MDFTGSLCYHRKDWKGGTVLMNERNKPGWLKHLDFYALDFIELIAAYFVSYAIRHGSIKGYLTGALVDPFYRVEPIALVVCWILVMLATQPFHGVLRRSFLEEIIAVLKHAAAIVIANIIYMFATQQGTIISRLMFLYMTVIYVLLALAIRTIRKWQIRRHMEKSKRGSLVVMTTPERAGAVLAHLKDNMLGYAIAKMILIGKTPAKEAIDYLQHNWVDEVLIVLPEKAAVPQEILTEIAQMGITVHRAFVEDGSIGWGYQQIEKFGGYTVISSGVREVPFYQIFFKRLMDILGGLVGSIITVFLMLFVGPAIYIKSPGPIFFKQTRIGKNGKKFKMYKFRSMYLDAEDRLKDLMEQNKMQGLLFKMDDDPRIIGSEKKDKDGKPAGIGNFIRRTSIDEFPQFFNVLKGDMSLVGTRPPTVNEWEQYSSEHRFRMGIKPGITGIWQTSGRNDITNFDEVIEMDREYIENWTIGMDIRLLLKTVLVVLKHEGAE